MSENEIIHLMSAGASIHKTFPVAVNEICSATKVYVIVEEKVFEDTTDEKTQKMRDDIRHSIEELRKIAAPYVKNGVHEKIIKKDTLEDVRIAVLEIYSEDPDAQYFFNVSGGTKTLSIGLFMMALWIEAVPYHIDQESRAKKLSVPKIHLSGLAENPNRVLILEKLKKQKSSSLSRQKLFEELSAEYVPIREKNKEKRKLKWGTFNSLVQNLLDWGFISEDYVKGRKKEKEYFITPDGEFSLNFINIKRK